MRLKEGVGHIHLLGPPTSKEYCEIFKKSELLSKMKLLE